MTQEFSGSTALVTGGTAGIGRGVALRLAALGAEVVVHGRDPERGAEVVAEVGDAGGRARFVAADLTDPGDVLRLAAAAGAVDVLVNNAGIYRFADAADSTAEMFDLHMAVNARAPMLLVGALAPGMAARGRGVVVNLSTLAASIPARGAAVYGASKAALEIMTRVWADEFGARGVRVNAVASGPVRTPGTVEMGEDTLAAVAHNTALDRVAELDEIVEAIVFLASDRAGYVTGTVLGAYGGRQAIG
ncbi:SDR family oxidoreductase [Actinacidiphila glaucinigra]|uniref:SDR family NAD(P)-dependent oxidoreductase n=1 Tax=Actinacidiphila glaucinigra TaxID=235986 RepID=UPI002DD8420F|nr:SDR family oxidoreductase [Actinacidiphila glaucinigra]WSD64370.1 SDR family oxidoreductase [Actinacidiphila glaucinigra]